MKNISKSAAEILASSSAISDEDKEIFSYGLDIFFSSLLELAVIFIISAFVGNFFQTLLYFASFIPLRLYAGGYHADTKLKCFLVSLIVYAQFTAALYLIPVNWSVAAIIISLVFTLAMVICEAPIIHFNKSVGASEKKVYRKFSLVIAFSEAAIILLLTYLLKNKIYPLSMALGQVGVSAAMASALIKRKITGK